MKMLMIARKYTDQDVKGWYISEKKDGERAFWDGGFSIGMLDVPWSTDIRPSTGLWTRNGKVINAPEWWINDLPKIMLDGELYIGINTFQELQSVVIRHEPDDRWGNVMFNVFDRPSAECVFADCYNWAVETGCEKVRPEAYKNTYKYLVHANLGDRVEIIAQVQVTKEKDIKEYFDYVIRNGGEGVVLRNPMSSYEPYRSHNLLKLKPFNDAEGVVIGHIEGSGRGQGFMGSLRLKYNDVEFSIGGFSDYEKVYADELFPLGSQVTFKYRELTKGGVPREARFWRKKSD